MRLSQGGSVSGEKESKGEMSFGDVVVKIKKKRENFKML